MSFNPSDPRYWCRECRPGVDPFAALLGLCYEHTEALVDAHDNERIDQGELEDMNG